MSFHRLSPLKKKLFSGTTTVRSTANKDWNHFEINSTKDTVPFSISNPYTLALKMLIFIGTGVGIPLAIVKIHSNRS